MMMKLRRFIFGCVLSPIAVLLIFILTLCDVVFRIAFWSLYGVTWLAFGQERAIDMMHQIKRAQMPRVKPELPKDCLTEAADWMNRPPL